MSGRNRAWATAVRWAVLFLLALLVSSAALWSAGCGGKEERGAEAETGKEEAGEEAGPGEGRTPAEPPPPVDEGWRDAGFSTDPQRLRYGTSIPGLDFFDFYWADKGEYVELSFEFRKRDGSEVTNIPEVYSSYRAGNVIELTFMDVPTGLCDLPSFEPGVPVDLGIPTLETVMLVDYAYGEPTTFQVTCTGSGSSRRPHRLTYKVSPMRVILGIWKR